MQSSTAEKQGILKLLKFEVKICQRGIKDMLWLCFRHRIGRLGSGVVRHLRTVTWRVSAARDSHTHQERSAFPTAVALTSA